MKKLITNGLLMLLIIHSINGQTIETFGDLIYEDTLDFTPQNSWITINGPETNIWEIGRPDKMFFNSTHNGNRAILTDSSSYYSNNCNDYFYITIPWSDNTWGEGILSFYHKFDTDTLIDGGVIEMSYDNGASWINILDDNNHISTYFIGLYEDTIQGGEYGFSGKSDGWQYVELYWHWIALLKSAFENLDTPMIRFRFISDEYNTDKEGWMIDDIVFRGYDVVDAIYNITYENIEIFPIPSDELINIELNNKYSDGLTISIFELSGKLIKSQRIKNKQISIIDLNPGLYIYKIMNDKKILKIGKLIKN